MAIKNVTDRIEELQHKLDLLSKQQEFFKTEIKNLHEEINQLIKTLSLDNQQENLTNNISITPKKPKVFSRNLDDKMLGGVCSGIGAYLNISASWVRILWFIITFASMGLGLIAYFTLWLIIPIKVKSSSFSNVDENSKIKKKTQPLNIPANIEKFIGENLINKIGIVITIIGVGIGVKYSIDNDLINDLTRVILGYLVGLALLGFSIKLKTRYKNFSAVLLSGAMAIMYLITFSAYSYYALFSQLIAFILMLCFTIYTVVSALQYNKQVIAIIGLVGAYAIPFLISPDTDNAQFLFIYILMINSGILYISFNKYWKLLYHFSFAITWIIYFSWYSESFRVEEHFTLSLSFLFLFFTIFYATFLAYKLLRKEKYTIENIILLLANTFIFYGIGYQILDLNQTTSNFIGLFTLLNALIHFVVSIIIYKQRLADRNLYYFIIGLALVFITIAVPVQFDSNWVTLFWVGEAALLFWIGRTKQNTTYEYIAYPLMLLAFFSILQDFNTNYQLSIYHKTADNFTAFFNKNFLTAILFLSSFGFILYIDKKEKYAFQITQKNDLIKLILVFPQAIFLIVLYFSFYNEIIHYFNLLYFDSKILLTTETYNNNIYNNDLLHFKTIWSIIYTILFFILISLYNIYKIRNKNFGTINLIANTLIIVIFLTQGLYTLSELRESYVSQTLSEYYKIETFNLYIRYIAITFIAGLLYACYGYTKQQFMKADFKIPFEFLLHITVLWVLSSELIHWLTTESTINTYKLGLSLLWGSYSLFLIILGIWKNKKHLRIGSISLFGVTLLKLFFYDIANLNTISKTIVLVSLGLLLLIISFLYNKYKQRIFDSE